MPERVRQVDYLAFTNKGLEAKMSDAERYSPQETVIIPYGVFVWGAIDLALGGPIIRFFLEQKYKKPSSYSGNTIHS